ncbi:MAG: PilX N-terminal domain-containing pilus assembly protein [Candidatus Zixiibacteriota bacterium]
MLKSHLKSERGMAALIALLLVGMLTIIGLAALSTSDDEVQIAGNQMAETRAFYAAESGLDAAVASLEAHYDTANSTPTYMPAGTAAVGGCAVTYSTVDNGAAAMKVLNTGSLSGLHALVKSFSVASTGSGDAQSASVTLRQTFQTSLVPLFQFAVFYGNDLEIAPGPDMNLLGRVHSNGNLYIQSDNTLTMDSYVTCSGKLIHGRKGPGGTGTGDVKIKNGAGTYQNMKNSNGTWLDGNATKWYDSSIARWNGRVQDKSMGVLPMNVPLNGSSGNPHKLIEPAAGGNSDSYENKATLKFINGQAFKLVSGTWTDVTADMTTKGIITKSNNKFFDGREGENVDVTDLDMGLLQSKGYWPTNGVLYYSDATGGLDSPALRLKNGGTLGAALTIASANPVYTLGDYNKTSKKPSAILADAFTVLSSAWDDSKGALAKSNRLANSTVVNTSYCIGNVNTTSSLYNGGFENLVRFLEDWSSKTLTWTGSGVCLWNSTQATGTWNGNYYTPPTRAWSYDTSLDDPNNLPPESPVVRTFQRIGWSQDNVAFTGN